MRQPFRLKSTIATSSNLEPTDVLRTKTALRKLGFYRPPEWGITDIPDRDMFAGLTAFQETNKLVPDGVMKPDGPTAKTLRRRLAGRTGPAAPAQPPAARASLGRGKTTRPNLLALASRDTSPTAAPSAAASGDPQMANVFVREILKGIFKQQRKGTGNGASKPPTGRDTPMAPAPPRPPLPGYEPPEVPDTSKEALIPPPVEPLDLSGPVDLPEKPAIFVTPPVPHRPEDDIFEDRNERPETKEQIDRIRRYYESLPGWKWLGGGRGPNPEDEDKEYRIPGHGVAWGMDSRPGSHFTDLTFQSPSGRIVHIQTVDVNSKGVPTQRELNNARRIHQATGETVILIPKYRRKDKN